MNQMARIEAKLDALLAKEGIDPAEVITPPAPIPVRVLTPAEQQAIDNAPKVSPVVGPRGPQRVEPATNAPVVSASTPPVAPPIAPVGRQRKD